MANLVMRHSISSELAQKMVDEALVKADAERIGGARAQNSRSARRHFL
ncbi:MAG TPA: hypothetical protein VN879_20000 [Candidatus Acidoferrales bacterium]|nr:hypothetical protein [Candidatus Acidoferrales bacterium]